MLSNFLSKQVLHLDHHCHQVLRKLKVKYLPIIIKIYFSISKCSMVMLVISIRKFWFKDVKDNKILLFSPLKYPNFPHVHLDATIFKYCDMQL